VTRLEFGIYAGGAAGTPDGAVAAGAPDDPVRAVAALRTLRGRGRRLLVRAYSGFMESPQDGTRTTPPQIERYLHEGRVLDLALVYRSPSGDVDAWCAFVESMVERYGAQAATIQVVEEPNLAHPGLDGSYPNVLDAVVAGVVAARRRADALRLHGLRVGFNAVADGRVFEEFWSALGAAATAEFRAAVGYVGVDTYPGVFEPGGADLEPPDVAAAVVAALEVTRRRSLPLAGLGDAVPLRVTENGWPTGPERPEERQAEVVEAVVRAVHAAAEGLGIEAYELFQLRDARSCGNGIVDRFGLVRDDYTPKPAFDVYRRLIAELA
jgi:hypothetical protein